MDPSSITEETVTSHLYPSDAMDVDLLIRTGGEYRTSNFLLWQASYSELYFTPCFGRILRWRSSKRLWTGIQEGTAGSAASRKRITREVP